MSKDKDARIAELEAENLAHTNEGIQGRIRIAELERKLAAQQMLFILTANGTDMPELLQRDGFEELDNLLAEERGAGRKEIEELQRQNAMLVDALKEHIEYTDHSTGSGRGRELHNKAAIAYFATAAQSAAWLEASHIEWMRGLEPVGYVREYGIECLQGALLNRVTGKIPLPSRTGIDPCAQTDTDIPLYAIPTKKD